METYTLASLENLVDTAKEGPMLPRMGLRNYFRVAEVVRPLPEKVSVCLSFSLFCKHPRNANPPLARYPAPDSSIGNEWYEMNVEALRRFVTGFATAAETQSWTDSWKIRVYLEKQFTQNRDSFRPPSFSTKTLLDIHPNLEICEMATESIGFNPGAMWPWLALGDTTLDLVCVCSLDADPNEVANHITRGEVMVSPVDAPILFYPRKWSTVSPAIPFTEVLFAYIYHRVRLEANKRRPEDVVSWTYPECGEGFWQHIIRPFLRNTHVLTD